MSANRGLLAALVILTFANLSQFGTRIIYPALSSDLITSLSMSKSEFGLVLTAMWLCLAVMQIPSGLLTEILGEVRVIFYSLALLFVSTAFLVFTPNFYCLLFVSILVSIVAGFYVPGIWPGWD